MSYILDALRKSEKERQAGQVPGLPDLVTEEQKPSSPRWLWLAGLMLLLNLSGLGYWLFHRQEPTPAPANGAPPASLPAAPAQPSAASADQAPPQPPIVNAGVHSPNPAMPAPVATPAPVPPAPPPAATVPPVVAAPAPVQPTVPTAMSPVAAPAPVTPSPVAPAVPVPATPPVAVATPGPLPQVQVPPAAATPPAVFSPAEPPPAAPVAPPTPTRKGSSSKAARAQPAAPPPVAAAPPVERTPPTYAPPRQARAPARALAPPRYARPDSEFDEADRELEREGEMMADAGRGHHAAEPEVSIRQRPVIRGGTPDLRELPLDFQERVPPMKISMFAYSKNPAERFVIIDMRKYRPGDRLPGGILLLSIQAENLLLELDGQKFLVPRF